MGSPICPSRCRVSMRFADLATWIRRGVLDANENKL